MNHVMDEDARRDGFIGRGIYIRVLQCFPMLHVYGYTFCRISQRERVFSGNGWFFVIDIGEGKKHNRKAFEFLENV